jgi:hypothetical protein
VELIVVIETHGLHITFLTGGLELAEMVTDVIFLPEQIMRGLS